MDQVATATSSVRETTDTNGQRWRLIPVSRSKSGKSRCRLDMADDNPRYPRWVPTLSVEIAASGAVTSIRNLAGFTATVDDLVTWIENGA